MLNRKSGFHQRCCLIGLVALSVMPKGTLGQDEDRLTIDSGSDVTAFMPLPKSDLPNVVFGTSPSTYVAVDDVVYDVSARKAIGKAHKVHKQIPSALTRDGKYFAYDNRTGGNTQNLVVLDCATGAVVHQLEVMPEERRRKCLMMRFTSATQLFAVISSDDQRTLYQWDTETGKRLRELPVSYTHAISHDGKFLAAAGKKSLLVVDLESGRAQVRLESPKLAGDSGNDKQVRAMAFAPDSSLLAGYVGNDIVVWNSRGKVIERHRLNHGPSTLGVQLTWLPDSSGWILHGPRVLLRRTGRIVWQAHLPVATGAPIDRDHLVFVRGQNAPRELVAMNWQREQILKSIEQMENGTAVLRPGDTIGFNIDVKEVRFGRQQELIEQLGKTVAQRLAQRGIGVEADRNLTLCLSYGESAGGVRSVGDEPRYKDAYQIYSELVIPQGGNYQTKLKRYIDQGLVKVNGPLLEIRGGMVDPEPGSRPRSSAESTELNVRFRLLQRGDTAPLWQMRTPTSFGYRDDGQALSAQFLRNAAVKGLIAHLSKAQFPYLIPNSPDLPSLPIKRNLNTIHLMEKN